MAMLVVLGHCRSVPGKVSGKDTVRLDRLRNASARWVLSMWSVMRFGKVSGKSG